MPVLNYFKFQTPANPSVIGLSVYVVFLCQYQSFLSQIVMVCWWQILWVLTCSAASLGWLCRKQIPNQVTFYWHQANQSQFFCFFLRSLFQAHTFYLYMHDTLLSTSAPHRPSISDFSCTCGTRRRPGRGQNLRPFDLTTWDHWLS